VDIGKANIERYNCPFFFLANLGNHFIRFAFQFLVVNGKGIMPGGSEHPYQFCGKVFVNFEVQHGFRL